MFTNIIESLENVAEKHKDKPIYFDGASNSDESKKTIISFQEFNDATRAIATTLLAKLGDNFEPQPIAVMTGRHFYTPACFLGVARIGCFYAPIDAELPTTRILQILSISNPKIIIADKENIDRAKTIVEENGLSSQILLMEDLLNTPSEDALIDSYTEKITESTPLYMIFTSGSSGQPKGVLTSHMALMCYLDGINNEIHLDNSDVLGNQSPLDYIAAIRDMYLPIFTGCSTVIIPRSVTAMPQTLFQILNEKRVTTLCWSSSGLEVIAKLGAFDDESLEIPKYIKRIVFSGSVISNKYLRMWQDAFPEAKFANQYGPTETTASCTYYPLEGVVEDDTVLPIGKPYKHYKIFLLSDDDGPVADGEAGEICVAGPALALGYYNNPDQTAKVFTRNPLEHSYYEPIYRTGDLGKYNEDGSLMFLGRKDRQIKHMGHRIELAEIEANAIGIDSVTQAVSMYDAEKELLYLFYTGKATPKEIAIKFRSDLPGYMTPRRIVPLDEIPTLPNGKINFPEIKKLMK